MTNVKVPFWIVGAGLLGFCDDTTPIYMGTLVFFRGNDEAKLTFSMLFVKSYKLLLTPSWVSYAELKILPPYPA